MGAFSVLKNALKLWILCYEKLFLTKFLDSYVL
jgi:hypothetical protein